MNERTIGMLIAAIAVLSLTVSATAEQAAQQAAAATQEIGAAAATAEGAAQAAVEKAAPSAEELLAQAKTALENEDYEAAINAAELILSQDADSAQAKAILETAQAKQAAEEVDDAAESAETVTK